MAADLCLPVMKLSHARGLRPDNTIPWTHITASDMFVIVKGQRTSFANGILTMQLIQGTTNIESLDVGHYIDMAEETRRGAEQAGITPQIEQLPIFGLTREALLALRYRLGDGQSRRLQLRMQTPADCQQIINIFRHRGLYFQEPRPQSGRPNTADTRSDVRSPPLHRSTIIGASEPDSLKHSAHRPPSNPIDKLSGVASSGQAQSLHSVESSSHIAAPLLPGLEDSQGTIAPPVNDNSRPKSSSLHQSYTAQQPYHRQENLYENQMQRRNVVNRQVSYSGSTASLHGKDGSSIYGNTPHGPAETHSGHLDMLKQPTYDTSSRWTGSGVMASSDGYSEKLPARSVASTNLTHPDVPEVPPRRDLPFKRPESRQSEDGSVRSRPSSSTLSLPPLRKPSLVKDRIQKDDRQDARTRNNTIPTTVFSHSGLQTQSTAMAKTNIDALQSIKRPESAPQHLQRQQIIAENVISAPRFYPQDYDISPNSANDRSQISGQVMLRGDEIRTATGSRIDSRIEAPPEMVSHPTTVVATTMHPSQPDKCREMSIDRALLLTNFENGVQAVDKMLPDAISLKDFVGQSDEVRRAALSKFIIESLQNPDFPKFCEDVENCWQRFALGK